MVDNQPLEFDPSKDAENRRKHGVSLARAPEVELSTVLIDARFEYPERRYRGWGMLDGLPHCLVFTITDAGGLRPISLRRAHLKEYRRYAREA